MITLLRKMWSDENAQDLIEYGLLAVMVSIAAVFALAAIGNMLLASFTNSVAHF